MKTFSGAAVGLAGLLAFHGVARAEGPPTLSFSWVRRAGAESCTSPKALAEAVERRLGRAVFFSTSRAEVSVEGQVERDPSGGWVARIAIVDDHGATLGTRELTRRDKSCRALDDELALVIGLMIDPDAALAPPPAAPRPSEPASASPAASMPAAPQRAAPAPAAAPPSHAPRATPPFATPRREEVAPSSPAPQPQPNAPWRGAMLAGAGFTMGLLPGESFGLHLRGVLEPPRGPAFELGGSIWSASTATVGSVGASVRLTEGILSVCPLTGGGGAASWIRMFGCVGARVGMLRVVPSGLSGPAVTQERATGAAAIEGRASLRPVGPLLVSFGTSLVIPIVRDDFFFRDASNTRREIFRMSAVAGVLELTVGVELP